MKLALLCLLLTNVCLFAKARTQGLSISLVSENETVAAGEPFTVGVYIQHEPEFHTYWKNPGIVGVPTTLAWDLPEGFTASEISWPYPEQCDMAGHPCHGYERDVLLLVTITPPADQEPGNEVTLGANSSWMCCAKSCYPGHKQLSLTTTVGEKAKPNPELKALFSKARQEIPKVSSTWKMTSDLVLSEGKHTLRFEGPVDDEPIYYFSSDGVFSSYEEQKFQKVADGVWTLTLTPAKFGPKDPESSAGVLHTSSGYCQLSTAALSGEG